MKRSASAAGTVNIGARRPEQAKAAARLAQPPGLLKRRKRDSMSVQGRAGRPALRDWGCYCARAPLLSSTYTIWNCTALIAQLCGSVHRMASIDCSLFT